MESKPDCQVEDLHVSLELHHVFVAASVDAPEIRLLQAAGFAEGSPNEHPGQGTACRRVCFENAYLELLWLTDREIAGRAPVARTGLAQRADPRHPSSPFGFGLRSSAESDPELPFETWEYAPEYLPDGTAIVVAANSELLDEPLIFVLPWSHAARSGTPDHPNGARRVTGVHMSFDRSSPSEVMGGFLSLGLISTTTRESPFLQIEFDHGVRQERCDLRPTLPVELTW